MKNPIITVINGRLVINGITFEHDQLLESKQYLQEMGADEALFYPEDDDMIDELHSVIIKMGEITPEASGDDILSYTLN
jgi:hypothetical protein